MPLNDQSSDLFFCLGMVPDACYGRIRSFFCCIISVCLLLFLNRITEKPKHCMAAEDNTREKERMIEQKQQREVELQRGREEEARPAEEGPSFSKL
jgi:hypothetical protein